MPTEVLLLSYCALIIMASMTGGWLPVLVRMTHLRTQLLMSFVAGLMLAIAMLHLMPHAAEFLGSASKAGVVVLLGIVAMFLLMRLFHAHDHSVAETVDGPHSHDHQHTASSPCGHTHAPGHDHCHVEPERAATTGGGFGWVGMMFGLGLHTMIDGVALAASVFADAEHGAWLGLGGLGTFLAVSLHKPLDAFAITSVMKKDGWSLRGRNIVNFCFSMACPLGALLFYFGAMGTSGSSTLLGWGLSLSAGFFVCIALADLLPEVAFHDHDRVKLTAALLLGIGLAVAVENLPGHSHESHGPNHTEAHDHDHGPEHHHDTQPRQ